MIGYDIDFVVNYDVFVMFCLQLKGFEFIKGVYLDPVPFDMERDLITPTYKKKRNKFLKYYEKSIEDMYKNKNTK